MATSILATRSRKILLLLLVAYGLGLAWGQVRLPLAAVKSLADYRLLRGAPTLSASDDELQMSVLQKWYLRRRLRLQDGTAPPRVAVYVVWNAGIVARVQSRQNLAPNAGEMLEGIYVCLFGAWLRIHTFHHYMT